MGRHAGMGLLPGHVIRFSFPPPTLSPALPHGGREKNGEGYRLKIPHTGWNQIEPVETSPLLHGLPPGAWVYFNHAYYCQAHPQHTLAITDYGEPFPSVIGRGKIYGIQFHPEKSQEVGLHILRNFVERVR